MMERYETYKDSGVEWIGAIPTGWEVKKLKYLLKENLKYGANESALLENREHPRYIRITDFGRNGKLREETFKSLPPEIASDYILENGDILFARSGATVGKTFQFKNYEGSACFAGYLIKASPKAELIKSDFLYSFTQSSYYEKWKESTFNQATIQNIGADKYAMLDVPLPPNIEQNAIANFLDRKTAEIDALIAQKERLLELYEEEKAAIINHAVTKGLDPNAELKDSGVEWLGEILAGWEVKKLKYLVNFHDNQRIPLSADQRAHMINKKYDYYGASGVIDQVEGFIFDGDYILLGEDGANLLTRSTALAFKASGKFWVNNHAHILSPKDGELNFFVYFLESVDYTIFVSGSAQPKLTAEALGTVDLIEPPKDQQIAIVQHIKAETTRIDAKIAKTQRIIELQKEYRTALISDAVTGKIKVPESSTQETSA